MFARGFPNPADPAFAPAGPAGIATSQTLYQIEARPKDEPDVVLTRPLGADPPGVFFCLPFSDCDASVISLRLHRNQLRTG